MSFGLLVKVQYLSNVVGAIVSYIPGLKLLTESSDNLITESSDYIITE